MGCTDPFYNGVFEVPPSVFLSRSVASYLCHLMLTCAHYDDA